MPIPDSRFRKVEIVLLAIIFAFGIFLRITPQAFAPGATFHFLAPLHPQPAWTKVGFDEGLYREYVNALSKGGITSYPDIVEGYIEVQKKLPGSILPPLRFLYIFTAYAWHSIFGTEALNALHQVAAFFSVLTLVLASTFIWRMCGSTWAIAIAALMAFAPTQLHMSQHALVDGFFTFWASLVLWLFWENLQMPRDWRWLAVYVAALGLLVLTKENSVFVWIALIALLVTNRWFQFGTVARELVIATILGPLLGIVVLIFLAGGIDVFVQSYQLSVGKNFQLHYAILTGDGPWYRYLVDLLLVSPIVLILALGAVFNLTRAKKVEWFFLIFIAASYLVMCNLKYGMNLRYANMWDLPLRVLAFSQLLTLRRFIAERWRSIALFAAVGVVCALEMRNYVVMAVDYPLYELISPDLMRGLKILKSSADLK
jgi:4-amino-4-deoxy-L-arabinose transferase-like glycosyltransferase